MPTKILSIVGARPQFVKAAVVSKALHARPSLEEVLLHTGQHSDPQMSEVFVTELGVPEPNYRLGIAGGTHAAMTGRMLVAIEHTLVTERPTIVLVYGDTNSTLAGALAASKLGIPVAHVEAGLRSFNRSTPEEVNRVVTDRLSSLLFCPTRTSLTNLEAEGMTSGVHLVGDVMYDLAIAMTPIALAKSTVLERLRLAHKRYAVATVHRAETTDTPDRLKAVVEFLEREARREPVVLVKHPRTANAVERYGLNLTGLQVCDPLGYLDMTRLLHSATRVYTDSGGLQKEAYFARVPCVTLRGETEWVETIDAGWNRLWTSEGYVEPRRPIDEYGEGQAAEAIVDALGEFGR